MGSESTRRDFMRLGSAVASGLEIEGERRPAQTRHHWSQRPLAAKRHSAMD